MSVAEVLPSNSTAFERSVGEGMTEALPVPFRQIMDPAQTPAAFLPFLAAHESVDLWYSDWTLSRKRQMVAGAQILALIKGTLAAAPAYLAYVDAEVVDRITYPARFVLGRSAVGATPLAHPPFKSRYLVKITLKRKPNSFVLGFSALGRAATRRVDQEPVTRAKRALLVAQGGDIHRETLVSFGWRRAVLFRDALPVGDALPIGRFIDRTRL